MIFPGTSSQLNGVFCLSADDCWAVGGYNNKNGAQLNQALRWNGTTWALVGTPNPGGTASGAFNVLFGIRCNSSSDCWAVGYYEQSGAELDEALHWNGTKWSLFSTPTPAGTVTGDFNNLLDVWCTSTSSCWAIGEYGEIGGPGEIIFNQALRWNGKKWSYVITPNPGGTEENSASALDAVRCTSATNCWAVGTYGFVGSPVILQNEALHWNGNSWSQITTPNPGGVNANNFNFLEGMSCGSPTSCWAVGALRNRSLPDHLTERGLALGRGTVVAGHHAQPRRHRERRQQRASRRCLHVVQQLLGRRGLRQLQRRLRRHPQRGPSLERDCLVLRGYARSRRHRQRRRQQPDGGPLPVCERLLDRGRPTKKRWAPAQRSAALERYQVADGLN